MIEINCPTANPSILWPKLVNSTCDQFLYVIGQGFSPLRTCGLEFGQSTLLTSLRERSNTSIYHI